MDIFEKHFIIEKNINAAIKERKPVVALESTVITHGLPYPQNIELAQNAQRVIQSEGALAATIGVIEGKVKVGLSSGELEKLATYPQVQKVSLRDFAGLIVRKGWGGTTVAGTMWAAHKAAIRVFSTGGIGGVHRSFTKGFSYDISTDLIALAQIPLIVVCSGAKSILNLEATLEVLETYAIPVIGYQTNKFPAFYARESGGLKTSEVAANASEVVQIARAHWGLGFSSGILVTVPPPAEQALPFDEVEGYIRLALKEAENRKIHGQAVTPFLLEYLSEITHGKSLEANLALLLNNARIAAQIAQEIIK
ncbi:MAG: pseudouridine-5'-phosphate glycosidase [Anaerolineales bacterium]